MIFVVANEMKQVRNGVLVVTDFEKRAGIGSSLMVQIFLCSDAINTSQLLECTINKALGDKSFM